MVSSCYLDSCVLIPPSVRDLMLYLSSAGFFRAQWSDLVSTEFIKNAPKTSKPANSMTPAQAKLIMAQMKKAFPDWDVPFSEGTLNRVLKSKTDIKDAKHLASAIDGECTYLVTFNIPDFDVHFARSNGVFTMTPDAFAVEMFTKDPALMLQVLKTIQLKLKNPPKTKQQFVSAYQTNNLKTFASIVSTLDF